ncbi:MAG: SRPBCC family protein [Anaerolineales bacterium]|nr:SRPBCC family protein [Anaerolineales bacterium]
MLNVESSVVINKPLEEVFAFASNGENTTKWQGGVEEVIPDGPPNVVGSRYTEVRKFMGQEMKSIMEVTAFEPNVKWAAKVIKGPVPFEVTVTYEKVGSATKMSTRVEGEPKGFFKIAEGMLAGQLEKSLQEDGERLKKLLEGG